MRVEKEGRIYEGSPYDIISSLSRQSFNEDDNEDVEFFMSSVKERIERISGKTLSFIDELSFLFAIEEEGMIEIMAEEKREEWDYSDGL